MTEMTTILIVGAGQIGSRHLQGLSDCNIPLRIYVQNPHKPSLEQAESRWIEVANEDSIHEVSYHESINETPQSIDIAIIATSSDIRAKIVKDISEIIDVKFWVLEKVLARNIKELNTIKESINKNSSLAWVNTPRRMMAWHKEIKEKFGVSTPLILNVKGDSWGLACNSIHFIDLLAWWTGADLESVSTDNLDDKWFESKRNGFWEVSGTLVARFSDGSIAKLTIDESENNTSIQVIGGDFSWEINETDGVAKCSNGVEVRGRCMYQSEMSAAFVESIIESKACDLPLLVDSIAHHHIFLQSMQEHWVKAGHANAAFVPIT